MDYRFSVWKNDELTAFTPICLNVGYERPFAEDRFRIKNPSKRPIADFFVTPSNQLRRQISFLHFGPAFWAFHNS
jgi:hypothetical protein